MKTNSFYCLLSILVIILFSSLIKAKEFYPLSDLSSNEKESLIIAASSSPTVATNATTNITPWTACLNASVNPNGEQTDVYFQYGTTTNYSNSTSIRSVGAGITSVSVSEDISVLASNMLYHYRIVAYNSAGIIYGNDLTFTTMGLAPIVTTNAASNITSTSVRLNAAVNPNGSNTDVFFDYGITTNYGNRIHVSSAGSGRSDIAITFEVPNLIPNALYHYRVLAISSIGTTYGGD